VLDDDDWCTNLYNDDRELNTASKVFIVTISSLSEDADFCQHQRIPEIKVD